MGGGRLRAGRAGGTTSTAGGAAGGKTTARGGGAAAWEKGELGKLECTINRHMWTNNRLSVSCMDPRQRILTKGLALR